MKTVAFFTLGCKVNTYDTEAMIELFENRGYEIVDFDSRADVYVINTCTVTNMGDRKSRQMIRKAKRRNPQSVIAVAGCYAQTSADELKKIPEVNIVIGNKDRNMIVDLVERAKTTGSNISAVEDIMSNKVYEELKITKVKDRSRALIKIQEGCSNFCSYCIIPYARGPVRSRTLDNILEEGNNIAEQGYREIVLTGTNVSSYGIEFKNTNLIDVLRGLDGINGIDRIRLGSLEPMLLDVPFIKGLKGIDKLCEHFHLSLQTGSDGVLKRMNRKYNTHDYQAIIENIRNVFPHASLTTDIMVGFPGESEKEFNESYQFIERIGFSKLHVFKYSKRKGTPAAKMDNQIPQQIKDQRSKKVIDLGKQLERQYIKQFLGKKLEVLFEQRVKDDYNVYEGHTKNYILVRAESNENLINKILPAVLKQDYHKYVDGSIL